MATWAMIGVTFSSLDPSAKLTLLGMLHNHVHKVQDTRPRVRMAGTGKVANGNAELWLGDTQIDRSGKPLNPHVARTPETVASGQYDEVRGTAAGRQGTGFESDGPKKTWWQNFADGVNKALENPWAKAIGIGIGAVVTIATAGTFGIAAGLAWGAFAAFGATLGFGAWDNATGRYNGDYVDSALGSKGTAVIDNIWNAQQIAGLVGGIYAETFGAIAAVNANFESILARNAVRYTQEEFTAFLFSQYGETKALRLLVKLEKTFANGAWTPYRVIDDIGSIRYYGGTAAKNGAFYAPPLASKFLARFGNAVDFSWGNSFRKIGTETVTMGDWIVVGKAARQRYLLGGMYQIWLHQYAY